MGTPAFEPERVLAGRYRLERCLGKGGMGSIWLAEHLVLQAPVAVKLIDRDAIPDEETSARFLREAKAAAALRSPHVVQILDYGLDEDVPFIVMELLEGENLSQRLRRATRLAPAETARIITHVGRAIGRAHEAGIVHRDLKPENVFLVRNEDEEIAKVLDFGVAKIAHGELKEGTRTRTGSILGTPYYMSPEQAQGNKAVDYRSDLWSLGVMAFECLTGTRPFYSDGLGDLVLQICVRELPVPSAVASVPLGFDEWFARAVAREPDLRFQSAREMTDALREILGLDPREAALQPEVVVSSGAEAPRGAARAADANAPTVALEPEEVQRLAQSGVDGGEGEALPTPGPERVRHSPSSERLERRRVSPSLEPPPSSSGLGTIVAVAAAALALGMAGGLVWLWQLRSPSNRLPWLDDTQLDISTSPPVRSEVVPLPPPIPPPPAPADATAKPEPEPPVPSNSAAPSPSAEVDNRPPAVNPNKPRPEREPAPEPEDAGVVPAPASDAGWVKPDWAVPDEEPRRAPDLMQDEEP